MAAGLYIHVPYCTAKCSYCAFYSMPQTATVSRYLVKLAEEYAERRIEIADSFSTIYIGGGTPSLLSVDDLDKMQAIFADEKPEEFTIEVNPDDVTAHKAEAWRALGVNRVSMGVQTLDDGLLKIIGRRHTAAQAVSAFETLRKAGFDNINVDAIMGLPGQALDSWQRTLDELLRLQPEHLSAYILEYEKGSRLSAALLAGRITPVDDDTQAKMYNALCDTARKAGFEHYEISNFALSGRHSRHNSSYWQGTPYLGIGPAAHSFDGKIRRYNPSSLQKWMDGQRGIIEPETETEQLNDALMTALRTARGFDYRQLDASHLAQLRESLRKVPQDAIIDDGTAIRITERSWLIADAITSTLFFE